MNRLFTALVVLAAITGCAATSKTLTANAAQDDAAVQASGEALNHYLAARIYERLGDEENAVRELRQAADLAPEATSVQIRLLGIYYANQDYQNAAVMARRALEQRPENVVLHLWLGQIYYHLDDLDSADTHFREAIEIDPDNTTGYEALAEMEEEANDLVAAVDVYTKLIELDPDSSVFHYRLGSNYLDMGNYSSARTEFERVVDLDEDMGPAWFLLGAIQMEEGDLELAVESFQRFLDLHPEDVSGKTNLIGALGRLGRFDEALSLVDEVISGPEAETRHHIQRLFLLLREGDLTDSSTANAPSNAPIFGSLLQALIRRQAGEPYREQIASLEDIEGDLDQESNVYLNNVISTFGEDMAGDFLIDELTRLHADGIESRTAQVILGRTLISMERDREAAGIFHAIIEEHGADKWIHYYLATVYDNLDEPGRTEEHLRATLAVDPSDADVMNFLGYFLAEENRNIEEAEQLLVRALEQDPDNGFYLDSLGWIYYRQGKASLAIEYIQRAIREMNSDDAILRDHLGDAYLLDGQTDKAVAQWLRARRLDPELEGVQEKLDKHAPRAGD